MYCTTIKCYWTVPAMCTLPCAAIFVPLSLKIIFAKHIGGLMRSFRSCSYPSPCHSHSRIIPVTPPALGAGTAALESSGRSGVGSSVAVPNAILCRCIPRYKIISSQSPSQET